MEQPTETRKIYEDRTDPVRRIHVYQNIKTGKFDGATVWRVWEDNDGKEKMDIIESYLSKKIIHNTATDIDKIKRIIAHEKL